ncbi:MAG: hypothetical protein ACE5FJ_05170, partial [Gemmatimonadales bacterium]
IGFALPHLLDVAGNGGSGKTLPFGALIGGGRFFGGVTASIQQLRTAGPETDFPIRLPAFADPSPDVFLRPATISSDRLSDTSNRNLYVHGLFGARLGRGISVGASAFLSDLDGVEGTEYLYASAESVEQSGTINSFRLGVLREMGPEESMDLVLLHSRVRMRHDVEDIFFRYDSLTGWTRVRTVTNNLDHTDTWGVPAGYQLPIGDSGWRFGTIATMNYKSHPKIPNYELMNIPRDPGNSWAYNLGVGVSRHIGEARFGVDLIYEPIWSNTWAEADSQIVTSAGRIIFPGSKTIENDFVFSNAIVRFGVAQEDERKGFQIGLGVRSISYTLEQDDRVAETFRRQREDWLEWTPTWSFYFNFPDVTLRYTGSATTGTGRPGVAVDGVATPLFDAATDIVLAPEGSLTLQDVTVFRHRISVEMGMF